MKRIPIRSATLVLTLLLSACSGFETRPSSIDAFVAGDYHYYRWSNEALENTNSSNDLIYKMDPVLREQLAQELQSKGYLLDAQKAEFTVNYMYAERLRMGERSTGTSNLGNTAGTIPNRNLDQASIDNAYALGGLKETSNIGILFRDVESNAEVWRVVITKIIENTNMNEQSQIQQKVKKAIKLGLKDLPPSS